MGKALRLNDLNKHGIWVVCIIKSGILPLAVADPGVSKRGRGTYEWEVKNSQFDIVL
jgi:uncharacterized membrane protein